MSNVERIDDYISNRLNEQDKAAFEKEMGSNETLRHEVELQQQIAQGIRNARAAELKRMLQNVPVSNGTTWSAGRIAATALTAGLIATVVYFYAASEEEPVTPAAQITAAPADGSNTAQPAQTEEKPVQKDEQPQVTAKKEETEKQPVKQQTTVQKKEVQPVEVETRRPDLQITDPTADLTTQTEVQGNEVSTSRPATLEPAKMEVAITSNDKKFKFHYQFQQGKLLLYGPFDKELYEVLEIHGDAHAVFLFYKANYYLLDETQQAITPLSYVRDAELLKKLKSYRGH